MHPKPGVAFLAAKANVPIVPVAVTGTENTMQSLSRLRRSPVRVEFGEPFVLYPAPPSEMQSKERAKDKDAALNQAADEIMCQIGRLLPAAYRGVYADHPRLKELLCSNGNAEGTEDNFRHFRPERVP